MLYMILYIMGIFLSLFSLIMEIIMTFAEESSDVFKFFGDKELYICIALSIILGIIAIILDNKSKEY